jgi:hypothetical protein
MPAEHHLKCDPEQFELLLLGKKKCELRFNDRDFKEGDILHLHETHYTAEQMKEKVKPLVYTGRIVNSLVTHVLKGPFPEGWGHCTSNLNGWVVISLNGAFMTINESERRDYEERVRHGTDEAI